MIWDEIVYFALVLILFWVLVDTYFRRFDRKFKVLNLIPAPPGWPIVGNIMDAFRGKEKMFKQDRQRCLDYYPIFRLQLFYDQIIFLMSPDDVEQILTSMKHITKGQGYDFLHDWLGTGLLTSTGSKWQTRRKILTPAFHFRILQDFLNIFNEETANLIKVLKKKCHEGEIDVVKPITEYTLAAINETAMGIKLDSSQEEITEYKNAVHQMGDIVVYRIFRPWLYSPFLFGFSSASKEQKKAIKILHDVSNSVIREREANFNEYNLEEKLDDLSYSTRKRLAMLDLLLSAKSKNKIDYEGIREEVDTFMFEGHDTTSMALCFALLMIANEEDVQEKMVEEIVSILGPDDNSFPSFSDLQEMKYMERCIKEILRIYPSVPSIDRYVGEEYTTKSGYLIPKNAIVNISIYDMHHNPKLFPNPKKFDPDRFLPENCQGRHPYAYIPFSAGPRNCIGQKFAMIELKATLCGILRKFVLKPGSKREDVVLTQDLVLRPNENGIKVKFLPRVRL